MKTLKFHSLRLRYLKILIYERHGCDYFEAEVGHDVFNMIHVGSLY